MAFSTSGRKKWSPSSLLCSYALTLLSLSGSALSGLIVRDLPGFSGPLPFTLETGYTTVGDVEFFYYFVQSESNPAIDPLLLYVNGGPGCSGINGFFYQIGPLKFNTTDYTGGLPTLLYEPNAWSKTANLLFVDAPVGTGFTYATTQEGYYTTDTLSSQQMHYFLRNWLSDHPSFQLNRVLIGSDSYAGITTPILATDIIKGNEAGLRPHINILGYAMGCPHTFEDLELNAKIPFVRNMALISEPMYEAAKTSCNGNYVDSTNANCSVALKAIDECIELISILNILEPACSFATPESNEAFRLLSSKLEQGKHKRSLQQLARDSLISLPNPGGRFWCRTFEYLLADIWLNDPNIRDALHVRPETVGHIFRCNITINGYTANVNNVVPYHKNLINTTLQVLVFNGDHDLTIPHIAVEEWISYLNLTTDQDWRPWFLSGQVVGYTTRYTNDGYRLTYTTLKGAGHSPAEEMRRQCYNMFDRWVHFYPL